MKTVKDDPKLGEIDFNNALSVSEVPELARLQAMRKAEQKTKKVSLLMPLSLTFGNLLAKN